MKKSFQILTIVTTMLLMASISICGSAKWTVKNAGFQYSMVVYGDLYLNNQKVDWTDGYFIAAFGPGGEKDCRSLKQIGDVGKEKQMPGMFYLTISSNANYPETLTFKVWDSINNVTYDIKQTVMFESQKVESNTMFDLIAR